MHLPSRAFAGVLAAAAVVVAFIALLSGAQWLVLAAAFLAVLAAGSVLGLIGRMGRATGGESAAQIPREGDATAASEIVPPSDVAAEATPPATDARAAAVAPAAVPEPVCATPSSGPMTAAQPTAPAAPDAPEGRVAAAAALDDVAVAARTGAPATATQSRPANVGRVRTPVSPEPEDVLDALLDTARVAGMPVAASLWLEDPATATMRRVAARGSLPPAEDFERIESSLIGETVTSSAARFGALTRVRAGGAETNIWRFAVPISSGEARGAVALDLAGSEPDRAQLAAAVSSLRSSLTGTLSLHVARVEAETARTLVQTAHDLARVLDADEVVGIALERAARLSHAQTASLMLLDDDGRLRIVASRGLPGDVVESTSVAEGEGIAGWVLASGQPVVVEDLEGRGPQSRRHGIRSAVSVPIADEDGILGVLNVGSRRMQARFSKAHVDALETLGRCTALALRNARASESTADLFFDSLKALALAMETKDPFARGGTQRVYDIASMLGERMGLDESELRALQLASLLHDIGMDAAGEGVATRKRSLSTVEWGMVKLHPSIAAEMLQQAPALREVVPIVYHHHEHYDGSGYLGGVSGERIPLGARILSVADAWVAMTSARPYRASRAASDALDELMSKAGTQFDPQVVDAFAELYAEGVVPTPVAGE